MKKPKYPNRPAVALPIILFSVLPSPRNEPWKMRSARIAAPEGNLIEIASDFRE